MQNTKVLLLPMISAICLLSACNGGSTATSNSGNYTIIANESSSFMFDSDCIFTSGSVTESAVPFTTAIPLVYDCSTSNSISFYYDNALIVPSGYIAITNDANENVGALSEQNCLLEPESAPVSCAFSIINVSANRQTATVSIIGGIYGIQTLFRINLAESQ